MSALTLADTVELPPALRRLQLPEPPPPPPVWSLVAVCLALVLGLVARLLG